MGSNLENAPVEWKNPFFHGSQKKKKRKKKKSPLVQSKILVQVVGGDFSLLQKSILK